ncbi:MAG: hypothetical protein MI746_00580, partial [Pseudomonadales bacterium]|nr:hypothetical protein [Pseudomonadales bacterium]
MQFENKPFSFSRLTLRFHDFNIEDLYIAHHNVRALPGLRLVIVLFLGFVSIPLLIEYYGFFEEGWEGYEYYLGMLPYRIGVILLLLA